MHTILAKYPSLKLLPDNRRLLLPIIISVLLLQTKTQELTLRVLSDAFWQVAVFVAMTLSIYHVFSHKIEGVYLKDKREANRYKDIVIASFMGVIPGCGGAIIIITQYVSGRISFGAVIAVLTSTMGDAAFLLLAAEPLTGIGIVILCFFVGIVSGVTVNKIHGRDFLRNTLKNSKKVTVSYTYQVDKKIKYQGLLWQALMIPGTIIGLMMAAQINVTQLFGISENLIQLLGAIATFSFILLWSLTREITSYASIVSEDDKVFKNKIFQKVALDTNFVTSWVVVAFLIFELVLLYGDFQLENLFKQMNVALPFMAVVIGMIPGCGPQIVMTSLYLSDVIPLSAQLGNAISNDGDALFPAIALSPKVAFTATFYSSIPALVVAYGYLWLFE